MPPRNPDEMEVFLRMQAEKTVSNQRLAQAGAEMDKWKIDGNFDFLKSRVLDPLRNESIEAIESAKWVAGTVPQVANIQGILVTMRLVEARINAIIQEGKNAYTELKDLQDATPQAGRE